MQVSAEVKQLEARLSGSVKRLQLDNQMLDATQPVVLAPASVAHAQSRTAQALSSADMNLIEFTVARSFANTLIKSSLGDQVSTTALSRCIWPSRLTQNCLPVQCHKFLGPVET